MVNEEIIREDFKFIYNDILAVLLFGSQVKNDIIRGDIDICIVIGRKNYPDDLYFYIGRNININKYDISIFEKLPLYMKIQVINNHKVIFTHDELELYEYFYFFRKLWSSQQHRQKVDVNELFKIS